MAYDYLASPRTNPRLASLEQSNRLKDQLRDSARTRRMAVVEVVNALACTGMAANDPAQQTEADAILRKLQNLQNAIVDEQQTKAWLAASEAQLLTANTEAAPAPAVTNPEPATPAVVPESAPKTEEAPSVDVAQTLPATSQASEP
jgi:hypothetical protein